MTKLLWLFMMPVLCMTACARFQPNQAALSPSDYSLTGEQQSFTMEDTSAHYDPKVLQVGASRSAVLAAYGDPNSSGTTDAGLVEDVYAFNPDGTKFVNPKVRPRNLALGFFTRGASTAIRQARLESKERKLTLFHVTYSSDDKIQSLQVERLGGAPEQLPAANQNAGS